MQDCCYAAVLQGFSCVPGITFFIPHITLSLYFCFFSIPFFCVCSDRENALSGRTRLLLFPEEGKSTFVLCVDETWRCLHTYKLTPCCWRRGSERCVSKLKHSSNMSIFLLVWADILNLNSQCLLSGGLSGPSLTRLSCLHLHICNWLPGASQMFIILSSFVTSSLCCACFLGSWKYLAVFMCP